MKLRHPIAALLLLATFWVGGFSVCLKAAEASAQGAGSMSDCASFLSDTQEEGVNLQARQKAPGAFVPDCCFTSGEDQKPVSVVPADPSLQPVVLPTTRVLPPKLTHIGAIRIDPPRYNLKLFDIGSTVKRE